MFSKEVWTRLQKGLWLYSSGCETVIIQGDTKKQELLKNPTKIEEIQEKKIY